VRCVDEDGTTCLRMGTCEHGMIMFNSACVYLYMNTTLISPEVVTDACLSH
jgi:hypothetical protein